MPAQKGGVDPLTRLNVIPKDSKDRLRVSEGPHFGFWVEASRWGTGCTQESVAVGERFGPKNSRMRIGLQGQDVRETGRKTPHREAVSEVQRQTDTEEAKMIPNFGVGPGWVVWPFRRQKQKDEFEMHVS